jgi:GNAT superfamily N-acetyltransferase
MKLREHASAREFLAAAAPVLEADEARHNLGFGICSTLIASPETYPDFHLWTVDDDGAVVGAALRTPPHNLWLARPLRAGAVDFLATELAARGVELPGANGATEEVEQFVEIWEAQTGLWGLLRRRMGIYALSTPQLPEGVQGRLRDATAADRSLLEQWLHAFHAEAIGDAAPLDDAASWVDRRLRGEAAGVVIWDDGGPVAFAGYGGETPNGIRIGPVYTPPDHRRRGYGSALTAALSRRLLAEGRRFCFLFTDLANPTSNRVYRAIGYERVCDAEEFEFTTEPRSGRRAARAPARRRD